MSSFLTELGLFFRTHKRLLLVPVLLLAIGIALLVVILARRSELAPMIYTLGSSSGATVMPA
ncbi:MAG: DUF5989 family protein [Gemmatimonadaceae bacterium]|nr:DUF5989 family protein [Gemmatimonadaceae bacterium]